MTQPAPPPMISVFRDSHDCVGFLRSAGPRGFTAYNAAGAPSKRLRPRAPKFDRRSQMETLLKKPEIFRDSMGRFDRHGKTLSKTAKRTNGHLIKKNEEIKRESDGKFSKGQGGPRAGAGRPKGSLNKDSKALKDMILASLDRVGGEEYLAKLAIENSSAFASLLGKVLPTTLAASESDGGN